MNNPHFSSSWVPLMIIALFWMMSLSAVTAARSGPNQEYPEGKRWALLVAGSNDYSNYRHQSDVCHAYQILKRGGLHDENIIVFMYDDIAYNKENPTPGVIINKPKGPNVYPGVPKDYTGNDTTAENFFAVLSGNRSATRGGSGKVLDSGPNDTIFIYYTDHGSDGVIGIPVPDNAFITAKDLIDALKKKHAAKAYKKMLIYLEACESGSMFEGLLPDDINIYATTASNATEYSWGCYCRKNLDACLGDRYSISWMEDTDRHDTRTETLLRQYETVRQRTLNIKGKGEDRSHVMQYGDQRMSSDYLVTYFGHEGFYNNNITYSSDDDDEPLSSDPTEQLVSQQDARLFYLRNKLEKAVDGSNEMLQAQKELDAEIAQREHEDRSVHLIGNLLFGEEKSSNIMVHVRPAGQPLVDDWDCFKTLIKTYERHCGTLSRYGRKYTRAFANMCNAGISEKQLIAASLQACPK